MKKSRCTEQDKEELFAVFSYINSPELMEMFLRDLLTEEELKDFAMRWKAVRMLFAGRSYKQVEHATGMSSATVARAKRWLESGFGSFKKILKEIDN